MLNGKVTWCSSSKESLEENNQKITVFLLFRTLIVLLFHSLIMVLFLHCQHGFNVKDLRKMILYILSYCLISCSTVDLELDLKSSVYAFLLIRVTSCGTTKLRTALCCVFTNTNTTKAQMWSRWVASSLT